MRFAAILLLAVLATLTSGCSPRGYFSDRWNDAKDILTVAAGYGVGAKARVGPVHAGLIFNVYSAGLRNGECWVDGYDGSTGDVEFLVVPFSPPGEGLIFSYEAAGDRSERGKGYEAIGKVPFVTTRFEEGGSPAYWSQIEVVGGLGISVRLGFNPGELLDFFLGWTTLDIYGDDLDARWERPEPKKAKEKPPEVPSAPQVPPPSLR